MVVGIQADTQHIFQSPGGFWQLKNKLCMYWRQLQVQYTTEIKLSLQASDTVQLNHHYIDN